MKNIEHRSNKKIRLLTSAWIAGLLGASAASAQNLEVQGSLEVENEIVVKGNAAIGTTKLGDIKLQDGAGSTTVHIQADESLGGGGKITMRNDVGSSTVKIDADANGSAEVDLGNIKMYSQEPLLPGGGARMSMYSDASAFPTLTLDADSSDSAVVGLRDAENRNALSMYASGDGGGAEITMQNSQGLETLTLDGDSADGAHINFRDGLGETTMFLSGGVSGHIGGIAELSNGAGTPTVRIIGGDEWDGGGGAIEINNAQSRTILLDGNAGNHGEITLFDADGTAAIRLDAYGGGGGGGITMKNDSGTSTVAIDGDSSNAGAIGLNDAGGIRRITLDADVSGRGRVTTEVLEITGGSDLSENFDITGEAKPGIVVSIDTQQPGALCVSKQPYDRTVVGVCSGANGVRPGMLMGQKGTAADGAVPVALTGRVYVFADADAAPIAPGDLLTTSHTPGHVMRVEDYGKAQGAIIGKAMTSLQEGTGYVLMLVSLQ